LLLSYLRKMNNKETDKETDKETRNMNLYIHIKNLIRNNAEKQYAQFLKEKKLQASPYTYEVYKDIEERLIAEYMQLEEYHQT
jgi:hypothetical protein